MENVELLDGPGVLVVGPNVWGKGKTLKDALEQAYKPKSYIAYAVPFPLRDIDVNDVGGVGWEKRHGKLGEIGGPFRIVEKGLRKG
jgi:hypothetical protein